MKTLLKYTILIGLVVSSLAQYGIPDDDDDDLPPMPYQQESLRIAEISRFQVTPTPAVQSYTKYEDEQPVIMKNFIPTFAIRQEKSTPVYSAPVSLAKTVVQPATRIEFRDERVQYEQPLVHEVRTTETPTALYEASAERSISPSPVSTQIQFTDSYSNQANYKEVRNDAVPIVKYIMEDDYRGTFRSETVTSDGTFTIETGNLKDLGGSEGPVVVKTGSYRYTGDDGKVYHVDWKADEGGFQASGDHLPKPPSQSY